MADDEDLPDDPITPLGQWAASVFETYMELMTAGFTAPQAFALVEAGVTEGWFDEWTPFGPAPAHSTTGDEDEDGDDG